MKTTQISSDVLKQFFLKDKIIRELESHRRGVERFMFLLGLVSATMAIPQMLSIYSHQDSSQVSLIAWSFYAFSAFSWFIYATIFKMPLNQRVQLLYFCVNIAVVIMIYLYR